MIGGLRPNGWLKNFFLGALIFCAPSFAAAESVGGQFESVWFDQIAKAQADPVLWQQSPFGILGLKQDADAESLSALLENHSPEQALSADNTQDNALNLKAIIDAKIHALSQDVAAGKGDLKAASQLRFAAKNVYERNEKRRQDLDRSAELAVKQHIEVEAKRLGISPEEAEKSVRVKVSEHASVRKSALRPFKEKMRLALRAIQDKDLGKWVNSEYSSYFGRRFEKQESQGYQSITFAQIKNKKDQTIMGVTLGLD